MRIGPTVVLGLLLGYLVSRQAVPRQIEELEMAVQSSLASLLARFEGFRSTVYQDQAGLWTIGFGHMVVPGDGFWHPVHNPSGRETITVEEARALKEADAADAIAAVDRCVRVSLTENQRNALVSLAFNIGAGAFCSSRVVRELNAGNVTAAADAFLAWNKITVDGQKVVSDGLTKRRQQEREIFLA